VATWAQFRAEAPDVAAAAAERWPGITALERGSPPPGGDATFAIAYLATVRPDGAPRLHPFCPIIAGGRLFAAIPRRSPKGDDLRREPRCAIHALPGPDDDELSIRAVAHEVVDPATLEAVREVVARSGVGGMAQSIAHDPLFELDLERVDVARWLDVGQPGTRAERRSWRPST
jgi:hypothetical protein